MILIKAIKSCFSGVADLFVDGLNDFSPYNPKLVLLGTEDSSKSVLFRDFVHRPEPVPQPELSSRPSTKVFNSSGDSSSPLLWRPHDESMDTKNLSSHPNCPTIDTVGYYPAHRSTEPAQPILMAQAWFGGIRATVVDMPVSARLNHKYLASTEGSLCYVISLDLVDDFSENDHISRLEIEIENAKSLASLIRRNDNNSFIILFTHAKEFETKIKNNCKISPSMNIILDNVLNRMNLSKAFATELVKDIESESTPRYMFAFCVDDSAMAEYSLSVMLRTSFINDELALAGFVW